MRHNLLTSEEDLNSKADFVDTRGLLPELLFRLIAASTEHPMALRIAFGGSVGQPGLDGFVETIEGFDPYVPIGRSYWEMGCNANAGAKATEDFKKRTEQTPNEDRSDTTFVFVTPRSATSGWDSNKQAKWIEDRDQEGWKAIKVIDASALVQWLAQFPGIDFWLANQLGILSRGVDVPSNHWETLQSGYGHPPLNPGVFLINREEACKKIKGVFDSSDHLQIQTRYPDEGIDLVCAYLATLDPQTQHAYGNRCLIIDDEEAWKAMCALRDHHVLVGHPRLDLDNTRSSLRAMAKRNRHGVIYTSTFAQSGNVAQIGSASVFELEQALVASGYSNERARSLATKCDGWIEILKRLLLDLSASPGWTDTSPQAQLQFAALLGSWDGNYEGDREQIKALLGKDYEEWARDLRALTLREDPPLRVREESWKFISRFEGLKYLGPQISKADFARFISTAKIVLGERHPKFDLENEKRWAASMYGKSSQFSEIFRRGISESLALIGAFPEFVSSCPVAFVEAEVGGLVRDLLRDGDWTAWATLQDVLPNLAEAAPEEFLNCIAEDLSSQSPRALKLFQEEGTGITGGAVHTGLLWALECVAWSPQFLSRSALILAKLAEIDPGGNLQNRPANSLQTIFLPWQPQTSTSIDKRFKIVDQISERHPKVGWDLVLSLLPTQFGGSNGSHKPMWRPWIPSDWDSSVLTSDYNTQTNHFIATAIKLAKRNPDRVKTLVGHIENLNSEGLKELLSYIESARGADFTSSELTEVWEGLMELVRKHKRHSKAKWALPTEIIEQLETTANRIKPNDIGRASRELFSDAAFHLLDEEEEDYLKGQDRLEKQRVDVLRSLILNGGLAPIIQLANEVQSPAMVGFTFGSIAKDSDGQEILPLLLSATGSSMQRFAQGFVSSRFHLEGWSWVQSLGVSDWPSDLQIAFISLLPFQRETWEYAKQILQEKVKDYWSLTGVNPHTVAIIDLPDAISMLVSVDRGNAALSCIYRAKFDKASLASELYFITLERMLTSSEQIKQLNVHACLSAFEVLQQDPDIDQDRLCKLEWAYLPLLNRISGGSPVGLDRKMASDPQFFSHILTLAFRSDDVEKSSHRELSEDEKSNATNAWSLVHHWNRAPGSIDGGQINEDALKEWLEAVKNFTVESGHFKVAQSQIGQVFARVPKGTDESWIPASIAKVLEESEGESMINGFSVGLFNLRGVHSWTHGRAEMALAENYQSIAEKYEFRFPRVASMLRSVSKGYRSDGSNRMGRDPFES